MKHSLAADVSDDGEEGGGFFVHLPAILWQRRLLIVVPVIVGVLIAIAALFVLPPVYRSSAIMLVQSPQLPNEVIGAGGEVMDRRMARIKEKVTSRPDLIALIDEHGLYAAKRGRKPLSTIVSEMRDAISLAPTTAELPGTQADQRTIAFELAFNYDNPVAAQAVAQDLMERIVELDASGSAEQATNTVQFLTDQANGLQLKIAALQSQRASISARNGGVLAGSGGMIMGSNTGSYDVQIASIQRDNSTLLSQRELASTSQIRDPAVVSAEAALAGARAVYSESHPDVVLAKQRLAEAREFAKGDSRKVPVDSIEQQLSFNNSQIAALRTAKARDLAQVSSALSAQSRAPLVQQQLGELEQQMTGLNEQFQDVSRRLLAAKAGVRAEDEQMGERLAVVEPPVVPDTPISPNRPLLAALGLGCGLGLGLLLALAVELILRPIRDPRALERLTGRPPLGIIPLISSLPKLGGGWRNRLPLLRRKAR